MYICKKTGLDYADLEDMSIGMVLDYMQEYVEQENPEKKKKPKVRRATQADFDLFSGG